jgi:hypothetical protein
MNCEEEFHKSDIAKYQLMTAVSLFLTNSDLSSVITLAGASSGILRQLVRNKNKEPFIDYACKIHREYVGYTPKRGAYSHHIDKALSITDHKHLSKSDTDTVRLNLTKSAYASLTMALSDYVKLNGQEEPFVKAFFQWAWKSSDGKALMKEYEGLAKNLKPK